MVKIILIKSSDEWATMKQACGDELVVYLSSSSHNKYIYIYIYITNCRQYCFGLLGLISAVLMLGWR